MFKQKCKLYYYLIFFFWLLLLEVATADLSLSPASFSDIPTLRMSSFTTYMNRLCGQLFNSARPSVFSSFFFLSVCVQTTHHNKFRYPFVNLSFHCILLSKITPDTRLHPPHPACTLFLMSSLHHFILFVAALTFSFTNPLHFMIY